MDTATKPNGPRSFTGVHHLKLPSKNILKTQEFYTKILHFTPVPNYSHYNLENKLFAVMFRHEPTNLLVEARYEPECSEAEKGWDPIVWGVGTRKDLEEWGTWFDFNNVKRSQIMIGMKGWYMAAEDPDGRQVRLYVEDEDHEWENNPTQDSYWLRPFRPDPNAK